MNYKEGLEAIIVYTGKRINAIAKDLGFNNGSFL